MGDFFVSRGSFMVFSEKGSKLNMLIVEDNDFFRKTLKETLETLFPSFLIHEAREGNEALQKVDALRPELIVMDIQLPGKNGLDLTREIKANCPDTKVMILTNYDIPEYREAADRSGASAFVVKSSLNWGDLEELIKSLIAS